MTNERQSPIGFQEWMQRRAMYLDEVAFEAGHWRDAADKANESAVSFARLGINAIYLLNGGSIGLLATTASALHLDTKTAVGLSVPFFVGLISALLSNFGAYYTEIHHHQAYSNDYWREYHSANRLYFSDEHDESTEKLLEKLQANLDLAHLYASVCRGAAIVLAVAGIAAFAIGGYRLIVCLSA